MSEVESQACPRCGRPLPSADSANRICAGCAFADVRADGAEPAESQALNLRDLLPAKQQADGCGPGEMVGRYKILEKIGEGGFGAVYLAEQEEPVRRRVALKVIKLGMDTKEVIARFEGERQALAMMAHSNIAKVLDAGTTDRGRPYFVMELVQGVRITDYCDGKQLPTEERLRLFMQVCRGIQHAHQKGIIHRGIKPSNILVALEDGRAVPKVIDFGIAKAVKGHLTDNTMVTGIGQFVGTAAYTSPEQADITDRGVDTRTDIYSLGVLLYELLTGRTPFDTGQLLQGGLAELCRTIQEREPTRPSTRLSTLGKGDLAAAAKCRQTEPPRLVSLVRGDLDWIVMKCLEKDRARRYETASSLADDIKHHLNSEPVVACPPSKVYRLQKLVRRNRLAFAAAALLVTMLVGGLSLSTWQFFGERQARQQAVAAKRLAEAASIEVKMNLANSHFVEAVQLIDAGRRIDALPYLAGSLAANPTNGAVLTRLTTLLTYGSWMLPCAVFQHAGWVASAQFSPDGGRIVTASHDHTACVWNTETGQALLTPLEHRAAVLSAEFSPDGKGIVTTSGDAARVWDAQTGQPLGNPMAHSAAVAYAEFSPDGTQIVTASEDHTARVWDAQTGEPSTGPLAHGGGVLSAAFSRDGRWIVTASDDHTARVWDARTGVPRTPPLRHDGAVRSARFSPDGNLVVTGSWDHTARVWDAQSGQPVAQTSKDDGRILSAEFSPDGKWIVTASMDGIARVWNATNGEALTEPVKHGGQVYSAHFSPDGKWIVTMSGDHTARVWNATNGWPVAEPLKHGGLVFSAQFSPDGRRIVTASDKTARVWDARSRRALPGAFGSNTVVGPANGTLDTEHIAMSWELDARRWDVQRRKDLAALKGTAGVSSAHFSPDGKRIVTAHWDNAVRIWDSGTGQQLGPPLWQSNVVNEAVFSRDGTKIVTASAEGTARVWDAGTGRVLTAVGHASNVLSAQFSPDGSRIMTASQDKTARIWDANNGNLLGSLGHKGAVISAEFSPDGTRVVTASWDGTARVWDGGTGKALGESMTNSNWRVQSARFSPDGERVVTASWGRTAQIWDATTGRLLVGPMNHDDAVVAAEFSPDGKRVVTASVDFTAVVWDAETGKALTQPLRERSSILSAHFSPDGNRIVTACDNGIARVWDVRSGQPLTDDLEQGGYLFSAQFSPDGERVLTASFERAPKVWDIAPSSSDYPRWLLPLAEAVSGQRLNEQNLLQDTTLNATETIARIRQELDGMPADDSWTKWGKWFLADPTNRTSSPFSR